MSDLVKVPVVGPWSGVAPVVIVAGVKRVALLLAVVAVSATTSGVAHAQSADARRQEEIRETIESVREELDEVTAEEANLLGELRVTQRLRAEEDARLAQLDEELTTVLAELGAAQLQLDEAIAVELDVQRRVEAARAELTAAQGVFSDQVVSAYMHGIRYEPPRVLTGPERIGELSSARALVDVLNDKQADLIDELQVLEVGTAALQREAQQARDEAAAVRDQVESRTAAVESARAAQAETRARVAAEAVTEERLLAEVGARRQEYERRIESLQAESDSIAELLRRRRSVATPPSGNGSLASPLASWYVTSPFGYRVHPVFGDRRLHAGLDLRGATGTAVFAAGPGEVVFAGWRGSFGYAVLIDHGGGVATLYAHQDSVAVAAGEQVARGDVIGAVGSTGYSTGPHLHWEVRVDGVPVDPLGYM